MRVSLSLFSYPGGRERLYSPSTDHSYCVTNYGPFCSSIFQRWRFCFESFAFRFFWFGETPTGSAFTFSALFDCLQQNFIGFFYCLCSKFCCVFTFCLLVVPKFWKKTKYEIHSSSAGEVDFLGVLNSFIIFYSFFFYCYYYYLLFVCFLKTIVGTLLALQRK